MSWERILRDNRIEVLRNLAGFATLPRPALRTIAQQLELIEVEAGATLLSCGSPVNWVFLVAGGQVGLMHLSRAEVILEPGDLFGVTETLKLELAPADLRALTNATVLVMERRRFVNVLATVPSFALVVLRGVAAGVPPIVDRRRTARRFERHPTIALA